jgi:phosphosulfolactate phosphohydrolase-like enzyme
VLPAWRDFPSDDLEADISFCSRESVLDVVPKLVAMHETAAEIAL